MKKVGIAINYSKKANRPFILINRFNDIENLENNVIINYYKSTNDLSGLSGLLKIAIEKNANMENNNAIYGLCLGIENILSIYGRHGKSAELDAEENFMLDMKFIIHEASKMALDDTIVDHIIKICNYYFIEIISLSDFPSIISETLSAEEILTKAVERHVNLTKYVATLNKIKDYLKEHGETNEETGVFKIPDDKKVSLLIRVKYYLEHYKTQQLDDDLRTLSEQYYANKNTYTQEQKDEEQKDDIIDELINLDDEIKKLEGNPEHQEQQKEEDQQQHQEQHPSPKQEYKGENSIISTQSNEGGKSRKYKKSSKRNTKKGKNRKTQRRLLSNKSRKR